MLPDRQGKENSVDRIIITVCVGSKKKEFDLEVPLDEMTSDALQDIADSVAGVELTLWFDPEKNALYNPRTGSRLNREKTLREECVWNGDRLRIVSRDRWQ